MKMHAIADTVRGWAGSSIVPRLQVTGGKVCFQRQTPPTGLNPMEPSQHQLSSTVLAKSLAALPFPLSGGVEVPSDPMAVASIKPAAQLIQLQQRLGRAAQGTTTDFLGSFQA